MDAYERGDYAATFLKMAEQGHANAQYNLGFMYHFGWGVPQDHAKAFHWYGQAVEQGVARQSG